MMQRVPLCRRTITHLAGLTAGLIALGGCAARSQANAAGIAALEQRVAELEAQRQRQRRVIEDLVGRVTALESRARRPAPERSLPVVRVRPDPGSAGPVEETAGWDDPSAEPTAPDGAGDELGPRPVLRLYGSTVEEMPARGSARPVALAAVTERLPVVPMPDEPPPSAPIGSLEGPVAQEPAPATIEDVLRQAGPQVAAGECAAALPALTGVLGQSPEHPLADDAMLLRARCYFRQGAHLRAIGELERMMQRYPSGNGRPEALLLMAGSYAAMGDRDRARELYGQVIRQFPRSQAASRATARVQELARGPRALEGP